MSEKDLYRIFPEGKLEMPCICETCLCKVSRHSTEKVSAPPSTDPPQPCPSKGRGMVFYCCSAGHKNLFRDEALIDLEGRKRNLFITFEMAQQVRYHAGVDHPSLTRADEVYEALEQFRDGVNGKNSISTDPQDILANILGRDRAFELLIKAPNEEDLTLEEAERLFHAIRI